VLAQQPKHVDALCLLGMIAKQEGRPDEAIDLLQRAIAIDPRKADAYRSLGDAQRSRGKPDQAVAAYTKAVELRPDWAEAHGALGDVFRDQGKFDRAVDEYNAVIRLKPGLPAGYLNLGRALQSQGKINEAISAYQKSTQLNPGWADAFEGLGNGLMEAGRLEEAATALTKALAIKPELFTADWSLGKIFVAKGRENDALACFQRAAKLNPNNAHAHFFLACRLVKAARTDEAIAEYREALRLKPDSPDWQYQLAAVSGDRSIKTAPAQYVRNLFDFYAPKFDKHLVDKLKYKTPKLLLQQVLEATQRRDMDVLDLGCGTGLCGVEFRSYARRMVGVDLSPAMLKVAESRKIYDQLTVGDLMPALLSQGDGYDLILAGDVLVYMGDLSEFMPAVAKALRNGGMLACSIEDYDGAGFFLHPEERFAHSIKYFRDLTTASGLKEISANKVILRRNKQIDVFGWTLVFGKP
jgi:predicted TPR repeat methyltransferase